MAFFLWVCLGCYSQSHLDGKLWMARDGVGEARSKDENAGARLLIGLANNPDECHPWVLISKI